MPTRGRAEVRQSILLVPIVLLLLSASTTIARAVTLLRTFWSGSDVDTLPFVSGFGWRLFLAIGAGVTFLFSALQLIAAVGLLTSKRWARSLGIVVTLIVAFFTLPLLPAARGIAALIIDGAIVATLVWDAMTDYPEEAVGRTWGEFGRPTDSDQESDSSAAN
jgi:hypothetical protein